MLRKYWMGTRNPYWINLFQYDRTTYRFCYHHIHRLTRSSLHWLYQRGHWNLKRKLILAHSIWEACWRKTWCLLNHYFQTCPILFLRGFLCLPKTFLDRLYWPWAEELSFFLVLWNLTHWFHTIQHRTVNANLLFLLTFLGFLYYRICKTLFLRNWILLYQGSRCCPLQIYFSQS